MAKKSKFKCSQCGRTFSMAAHLARHQNTVHASTARRKPVRKKAAKRVRRKLVRPAARAEAVPQAAAEGPAHVIGEIRAYLEALIAQRAELDSLIGAVDGALAATTTTLATRR